MHNERAMIDSHVHFYTEADLEKVAGKLPYTLPKPHSLTGYLAQLSKNNVLPRFLNNVHLSILPDSENVFASFEELKDLQARDPATYSGIRLVGTIKADPAYATQVRLAHPQVAGIRIVLHDAKPGSVRDGAYSDTAWNALYDRLRDHQHVHVYAQEAETNLRVLRQIPRHVRVMIDHLGSCHASRGAEEEAYVSLLREARERGNVWFKGPGYRTSTDVEKVLPFASRLISELGAGKLILEATDAPHVGADSDGIDFARSFDTAGAFGFVQDLAERLSVKCAIPAGQILSGAAAEIFNFD